ncbi:MAG: carbohydrate binding family 9 domain-containing protein, partial [Planctomycetota bacterium]
MAWLMPEGAAMLWPMMTFPLLLALAISPQAAPADTLFHLPAQATSQAPVIDGVLADGEWDGAAVAEGFVQYQPQRGDASVENTQVFVLQDAEALYVAFKVFDSEVPTAQLTRRDGNLTSDDAVAVLLDTYNDRQTGYVFFTNLLGTQQDGRVADDGRTVDNAWDAEWSSAASRTEFGWIAEFAIPFAALRYEAGEDKTWGINFGRTIRRTLEISHWTGPLENPFRISQGGELRGLTLPRPVKPAEVIVYGLTRAASGQDTDWD